MRCKVYDAYGIYINIAVALSTPNQTHGVLCNFAAALLGSSYVIPHRELLLALLWLPAVGPQLWILLCWRDARGSKGYDSNPAKQAWLSSNPEGTYDTKATLETIQLNKDDGPDAASIPFVKHAGFQQCKHEKS